MPIYDYRCGSCGRQVEVVHGINSPGPEHCPHCGKGPMRKLLAPPAIHFKGTGWAKKERAASRTKARSSGDDGAKEPAEKGAAVPADGDGGAKDRAKPGSADGSSGSTSSGEG